MPSSTRESSGLRASKPKPVTPAMMSMTSAVRGSAGGSLLSSTLEELAFSGAKVRADPSAASTPVGHSAAGKHEVSRSHPDGIACMGKPSSWVSPAGRFYMQSCGCGSH